MYARIRVVSTALSFSMRCFFVAATFQLLEIVGDCVGKLR